MPDQQGQPQPRPPGKPLWRRAYDAVEKQAAPPMEGAVRTATFADALSLAVKLQSRVRRGVTNRTAQLLHLANLPAASDIARLRKQVALLDHELRRLNHGMVEATEKISENAPQAQEKGADSRLQNPAVARLETDGRRSKNPHSESTRLKSNPSKSGHSENSGKDDRNVRAAQPRSPRPR